VVVVLNIKEPGGKNKMFELVHEYPEVFRAGLAVYHARAYGDVEENGVWGGYLVFVPVAGGRVISTDRETTQRTLEAVDHWAQNLSSVYLEGAFTRALERQPEVQLARRLAEIEAVEADARGEAEALERAAAVARTEAAIARDERQAAERALADAAVASAEESAAFLEEAAKSARAVSDSAKRSAATVKRRAKRA
jgi:hypothetical protein